ncbi:MAG: hypothetical protein AMXMBFR58_37330 [Phycisphaerae bacterium]
MSLYRAETPARVYLGDQLAAAVYRGEVIVWRRDPLYLDAAATITVTVPTWAALADVGVLGGGGGGATADNGASTSNGSGGNAAVWATETISVVPGQQISLTIGPGGAGGSGGVKRSGTAGTASSASSGTWSLTSAGGTPGVGSTTNDDVTGHGAYSAELNGAVFPGGVDVAARATGSTPGGGGGGGPYPGWFGSAQSAGPGAPGSARIRWRSY